jgi:hypothetical protein
MNPRCINSDILQCKGIQDIQLVVSRNVDKFNSINCSTALHRLALFGVPDSEAASLSTLVQRTVQVMSDQSEQLTAKTLSSIAWAIAKIFPLQRSLVNTDIVPVLFSRIAVQIATFDACGIAQVVWAMATLRYHNPEVINGIRPTLQFLLERRSFKPQEFSM